MTDSELEALAADWVLYHHAPEGSMAQESPLWVCEKEWDLVRDTPEDGWRLILKVMQIDCSSKIFEVLSAGPLEDLLVKHGSIFIDRIEATAHSNPQFAQLLGGVWRNAISLEIWDRVQAVWDRSGWDGND